MTHHCENGVVILLVFIIKENQLCPEMRLLCCTEDLLQYKASENVHTPQTHHHTIQGKADTTDIETGGLINADLIYKHQ